MALEVVEELKLKQKQNVDIYKKLCSASSDLEGHINTINNDAKEHISKIDPVNDWKGSTFLHFLNYQLSDTKNEIDKYLKSISEAKTNIDSKKKTVLNECNLDFSRIA